MAAPSLKALFSVFARHGNLTFGGGNATIATLHRQVVERQKWLAQHPFDLAYGLSRLTPGTNLLAFSTAVGWLLRGWAGALVTLVAGSLPCAALAILITAFYELWSDRPVLQVAIHGATAAAVAVMFVTGITIIRPHWQSASWPRLLLFVGGSFAASTFLSVPPIRLLIISTCLGCLWPTKDTKS